MEYTMESLIKSFTEPERNDGEALRAEQFNAPYTAVERYAAGSRMTTVERGEPTGCHIFFLHGGAYVMEAMPMHGDIIRQLADRGFRVTALHYPLAPEHCGAQILDAAIQGYDALRAAYPEDEIAIFGDSAGGGLAVLLLMQLRERGDAVRPGKTVLASPWVDISLSNPALEEQRKIDRTLPYEGCAFAAEKFAAGRDKKSPELSPLYGNLDDLGEILMFFSSQELLCPDCERFVHKLESAEGSTIRWHKENGLYHDYLMIVDQPASQQAFEDIKAFLTD